MPLTVCLTASFQVFQAQRTEANLSVHTSPILLPLTKSVLVYSVFLSSLSNLALCPWGFESHFSETWTSPCLSLSESASFFPKYPVVRGLCIQQPLGRGQVTVMPERSLHRSYSQSCHPAPSLCTDQYRGCLHGHSGFGQWLLEYEVIQDG